MILAEGATLDPIQLLITQLGVGGIVIALLILGFLWTKPSIMREFQKSDERDEQKQALIDSLLASQRDVLPLLVEVDKRLIPLMDATQSMLKRVEALLDRVEREWDWRERRGRAEETSSPPPRGGRRRDYEDGGRGGFSESPGRGDRPPNEEGP